MAPACIRIHNALRPQLPFEVDANLNLQGHYINYKYASTLSVAMIYPYAIWQTNSDSSIRGLERSILILFVC